MADFKTNRINPRHRIIARIFGLWFPFCGASLLSVVLTSLLFAGPFNVYYNWQTGKFTVIANNKDNKGAQTRSPRKLLALLPANLYQPGWLEDGAGALQGTPAGLTQVSLAAFDPVNNALRIRAGVTPPAGQATPSDADQVFSSIFDTTYDAIRVNCISGCGGGGGTPGGANTAVQFNSSGSFGGDTTNFYYNDSTHSLGLSGGLTLGSPLGVLSGGTGTTSPTLTAGSNISVSGTWPGQTVAFSGTLPATQTTVTNNWITSYNATTGAFTVSRPSFSNIAGSVAASQIPGPTTTTLGGIEAVNTISHEWINSISTNGVPALSQPAFSDMSGTAMLAQLPSTLAQFTGTITVGDCAKWSSSAILADAGAACGSGSTAPGGGNTAVQFNSSGTFGGDTGNFYYNTTTHSVGIAGGMTLGSPLGVSSGGTGTTTPNLVAGSNISVGGAWPNQTVSLSGVIPPSSMPAPSSSTLGGVESAGAISHEWINSISTAGIPALSQPAFSDVGGTATLAQLPSTLAQFTGAITAGDCAKWSASGILTDAGAVCGSGGATNPGGSVTQYQFNNTTFGGAVSTYNSATAESTFPNINNIYYVDGSKYSTVEAVIADPNFKGGTIISTVPETFSSSPFESTYPMQLMLIGTNNSNVWTTNTHINVPAQDKLIGSGSAATIIRTGSSFPAEISATLPAPGTLTTATTGGTIPASYFVDVVFTAANGNGETPPSSQASIQVGSGTSTNTVTLPAPGAIANATGMNVYACDGATSGCSKYFLIALNQPLTSAYTITSVPAAQTIGPPSINTSASLISLNEGGAVGAAGQFTRVEDLQIDCNLIAGGIGLFNRAAQEQSGAFHVQIKNCEGASIDIEGPGAQNSEYEHLIIGGAQIGTTIGFRDDSAGIRGLNDVTIAPPSGTTQGATAIDLINTIGPPLGCYRDIHIEDFANGLYTQNSPACVESISGLTNVGNLVHFDVNSHDDTAKLVFPNGATNAIQDDVFSYSSGNRNVGMYWIGNGVGAARSRYSSETDVAANFQGGLDILGNPSYGFTGTLTAGDCVKAATATTLADAGAACGSGGVFTAGGDLTGTSTSQTVSKLQGNTLTITSPTASQYLGWNGSAFVNQQASFTQISGTVGATQLPAPTATKLGGIESFAAVAHDWINSISTAGVPSATQPAFSDLSGTATLAQLPSTVAQFTGAITANDCAKWSSSGILADAGAACGSGGGGVTWAGDLAGSTNTTQKVVGIEGVPVSATPPSAGQVLVDVAGTWTPSTNTPTGAIVQAPANATTNVITPTTDTPSLLLNPFSSTQTSDVLDVKAYCSGTLGVAFSISISGNMSFCGNRATYGVSGQATYSDILLIGGNTPNAQPFVSGETAGATNPVDLYFDSARTGVFVDSVAGDYTPPVTSNVTAPEFGNTFINFAHGLTANKPATCTVADTYFATDATAGTNLYLCTASNTWTQLSGGGGGGGGGTVTSVGLVLPSIFAVTGSPVTTSGTLTGALATETANTVFAGPTSGIAAAPSFRSLAAADLAPTPISGDCPQYNGTTLVWAACGSGGVSGWSAITNPTANLTLSMAGFTTTFNWTNTALGQFAFDGNGDVTIGTGATAAIADSPILNLQNEYENGTGTYAADTIGLQNQASGSINGVSTVNVTHSGSSGGWQIVMNSLKNFTAAGAIFSMQQVGANVLSTASGANPIQMLKSIGYLYTASGTIAVGDIVCMSTTAQTVVDCPLAGINWIGIAAGTTGSINVSTHGGTVSANFDAATVTAGDVACAPTVTAGKLHDNALTACAAGQMVGVITTGGTASTGTILIR
ncbi:MAG TPA: hypothetical protein VMX16_02115 [Terriglobia bacterium]|nr:hypothetical protein [Terriglobia bacterium]